MEPTCYRCRSWPCACEDGQTIIHGDCRDVLPLLDADSVDLVLTDPPYGVRDDQPWDNISESELAAVTMRWLSEARRFTDRLACFFSTIHVRLLQNLCHSLYPHQRLLIWDKPMGSQFGGSSNGGMWYAFEPILHCHSGYDRRKSLFVAQMLKAARVSAGMSRGAVDMVIRGKKTGLCYRWEEAACLPTKEQCDQLQELLGLGEAFRAALVESYSTQDASRRDVFSHRTVDGAKHPCEKPVGLLVDIVDVASDDGETLLDPFMGSGTTLVAAKQLGRRAIGIEIEERYCAIAARRLQQKVLAFPEDAA